MKEDRRISSRFKVKEGSFVFINNSNFASGEIIDISPTGICINIFFMGEIPEKNTSLNILTKDGFFINNIFVKKIHESCNNSNIEFSMYPFKKYGLKFEDLTKVQNLKINQFLKFYSTEPLLY